MEGFKKKKINRLKLVDYVGKLCVEREKSSSPQIKFLYLNSQ